MLRQIQHKRPAALYFGAPAVFLVLGLLRIWHHELWADETEPWLLARDSHTLAELLWNKRYEGHPNLWYLLLFGLAALTEHVQAMQVAHVLVATAAVAVFVRYAPFSAVVKILFTGGYFIFYEYCVISRLYALGLLLTFAVLAVYPVRHRHPVWFGLLLALLAHTNLFGFFMAAGLWLILLADWLRLPETELRQQAKQNLLFFGLVLAAVLLSFYTMIPASDAQFAPDWKLQFRASRLVQLLATLWNSFVPIPLPAVEFWNSNFVASAEAKAAGGLVIWLLSALLLLRRPRVLALYVFVTAAALLFFYVKYMGFVRHHGHFFVYFITCLWLVQRAPAGKSETPKPARLPILQKAFLYTLLMVHVVAGLFASFVDWKYPFSPNAQAARFLQKLPYRYNLVAPGSFHPSALSAYLNKPVYYTPLGRFGSFYQLSAQDRQTHAPEQAILEAMQLAQKTNTASVVVLFQPYKPAQKSQTPELLLRTEPAIIGWPDYYLYLVK